jgi:hypothetical protein
MCLEVNMLWARSSTSTSRNFDVSSRLAAAANSVTGVIAVSTQVSFRSWLIDFDTPTFSRMTASSRSQSFCVLKYI